MSGLRSIYVVSLYSIFPFQPYFHYYETYNLIKADAHIFVHFLEYLLLFLHDSVDEKSE